MEERRPGPYGTAITWKLCCHWLKGLWQHHSFTVRQGHVHLSICPRHWWIQMEDGGFHCCCLQYIFLLWWSTMEGSWPWPPIHQGKCWDPLLNYTITHCLIHLAAGIKIFVWLIIHIPPWSLDSDSSITCNIHSLHIAWQLLNKLCKIHQNISMFVSLLLASCLFTQQ